MLPVNQKPVEGKSVLQLFRWEIWGLGVAIRVLASLGDRVRLGLIDTRPLRCTGSSQRGLMRGFRVLIYLERYNTWKTNKDDTQLYLEDHEALVGEELLEVSMMNSMTTPSGEGVRGHFSPALRTLGDHT